MRVAIVGSGPAGFYAAGQLLSSADPVVTVDVFDRLMTPWGLVRFGVAPDHPKIKSVTRVFEKTARRPGFRFHGNVEVGLDVSHEQLAAAYHAVLYAVGTPGDRRLGIPGEDLPGSESATEFVAWYNGHPDYADMDFDLACKRAVVIGNGNVALDVARMLALSVDELQVTDIADHSIELLRDSEVEEIVVLGRRGPVQAAFTNPELRELADLELADVIVDQADMRLDPASAASLEQADGTTQRNVETLSAYAGLDPGRQAAPDRAAVPQLPGRDRGRRQGAGGGARAQRADRGRGRIAQGAADRDHRADRDRAWCCAPSATSAGRSRVCRSTTAAQTVLNQGGRVLDPVTHEPIPGLYAAGWIKRGPSGVIGTNKKCAQETTALLLEDFAAGLLPEPSASPDALLESLRDNGLNVIDYSGWEAIDAHERALGEPHGRPRVKLVRRDEQLKRAASA